MAKTKSQAALERINKEFGITGKYIQTNSEKGNRNNSDSSAHTNTTAKTKSQKNIERINKEFGITGKYIPTKQTETPKKKLIDFNTETKNAYSSVKNKMNGTTTFTSNLTEDDRQARIKEIKSELSELSRVGSGLSRASLYGNMDDAIAKNTARRSELTKELQELERVGTYTGNDMLQWEIEDSKKNISRLQQEIQKYGQRPSGAVSEEWGKKNSELFNAKNELKELEKKKSLYDDISDFGDVVNEDDFWGQWRANYRSTELSEEAGKAFSAYMDNPTEENKETAFAYQALVDAYLKNNENALDDEGQVLSMLSDNFASYLAQQKGSASVAVPLGIAGGAIGLIGGGVGAKAGWTAGYSIGSGINSYNVIRGSLYSELLSYGMDEENAAKLANDDAIIEALIESGETAKDWAFMLFGGGIGKGVGIGSKVASKATDKAAKAAAKFASKPLTNLGLNIAKGTVLNAGTEYLEEGLQGATSRATREKALSMIDKQIGRYGEGNIDLYNRPIYKNGDGTISTVDSVTFTVDDKYLVLPTIVRDENGKAKRLNTDEEIFAYYEKTGEYLGEFDTLEEANVYANRLHSAQAYKYSDNTSVDAGDSTLKGTAKVLGDAVFGGNTEALSELHGQGVEGFKTGLITGGIHGTVRFVAQSYAAARTVEKQNAIADFVKKDEKILDTLIEDGKASGEGTISSKLAKEVEQAKENGNVTREQVKQLIASNDVYHKAGEIQAISKISAKLEAQSKKNEPISVEDVKKATGFGEEGSKIVTELANKDGATFRQAEKAVKAAYMAGFTNVDSKKLNFKTETQINAFTAGKKDRTMQDLANNENAKNATVYDGVFTENEYTKNFTKEEKTMISTVAKSLRMDISAVDKIIASVTIENGNEIEHEANASHFDGKMEISSTSQKVIHELILHEGGHRMKQLAPTEFGVLMDALYARAKRRLSRAGVSQTMMFDNVKREHDNAGIIRDTSGYLEEFAVRELETIFSSAEEFNKWYAEISGDQQLKTNFEKFVDWILEVIDDIKLALAKVTMSVSERSRAYVELERIKELYGKAYKASTEAVAERRKAETNSDKNLEIKTNKEYNGNISHSLKWHPDLTYSQLVEVEKWLRKKGNPESTRITDKANWYSGRINGYELFVIYSTEDVDNPTILYEVKGAKANLERDILMDLLEDKNYGKSANGKSSFAQRVSKGSWMQNVNNSQNNLANLGSGQNNQNVGVLQGQSKRNGSRAFWNVVENLFKQQEVNGDKVNYSLKSSFPTDGMSDGEVKNAQKIISSLKTKALGSKYVDGYASYTLDRIEREIRASSSSDVIDYAKSYVTWVSPIDFVYATTTSEQTRQALKEEAGTLNIEKLKGETQPIHLTVDFETGEIVGHEGRHRMLALQQEGIDNVAIIIDALNDNRYHTKPIEFMSLTGQHFQEHRKGLDMFLHNMLPLSQRYADVAKEVFTKTPKGGIQYSLKDSEGNTLTEAQQEYFKDSKVRDENGNLLVVYHGSPSKFTVFNHRYLNTRGNSHGRGFYFTEKKSLAEGYEKEGGQLLKGYLNITKPLSEDKKTMTKADLLKIIKATCKEDAKMLVVDGGYDNVQEALRDTWISNCVNTYEMSMDNAYREVLNIFWNGNDNDVELISDLTNSGAGNENTLRQVYDVLGYDGVIYTAPDGTHEFVSLVSEQFKDINNTKPTTDPDINFSLKDIKEKYADKTDHLYIYEKKNTISIDNMVVKKEYRNKGVGTAILNDVINYADKVQKTITLTPTSEFGTKERLKKWYKANGFVENKGRKTDFTISDTMYRLPSMDFNERISSNELDIRYSLKYSKDIAEGQTEYINKHKTHITASQLKEAQKVTNAMVDVMMKYSSILPEDKIGKVLTKNGSYDRSVENTTICVRTLAYNEFVDKVQEELGRPLTQMESFLVSQKLYDIATEPQCLYCYVSLDRKAFNDMLLRYMQDRDTIIAKYNKSDKSPETVSSLYEEYLHGRKDTKEMKTRFNKWLDYVDNGTQLLSLADIATEDRQTAIKSDGGILAEQLADARKYAQAASWSKIQKNYVAYRDEILKLGDRVVKNLNEHYGLRWYSFSDYSAAFIVENMQQITDASIRGLKGLAYTKDTDFAEIFAPSGMNINISVFVNQDKYGNFFIDEKQSANIEKAIKIRRKYPNVGIVATVTNDEALRWVAEQEWSDVIIPFHIVRTGTDVAEYYNWLNYTTESADTIKDKDLWNAYVDSLNPKSENARKKVSKNIYPSEHKNDKATYLNLCESRGLTPRFVRFAGEEWYMKLVNETRLSADDSSVLKPKYNLDVAKESFQKFVDKGGYKGGWYKDGVNVDAEAKNVAGDVLAGKKANEVDYGVQDGFEPESLIAKRKTARTHGQALSLKGGISNTELLDTIDDMRKGKRNATAKLAKYADDGAISTELYTELVKKYGAIPSGERPHRDVQVPQKTAKNKKVSQTVRTILEAKATPDEVLPTIEKMVEDGIFSYDVYTDKQAIKDSEDYLQEYGWAESYNDWMKDVEKGIVSKQHTVMGWALYNNAVNTATTTTSESERKTAMETALNVLDAMVRHQRNAAQALQATRVLKKLSPETQLYGVQKSVQALQKELADRYGDKAPDLKIDEELAEQFINAKTPEERAEIEKEIYKDIGRQMPSRFVDKWNAWRYLAMLGNLRTHVRNVVGNAGFAPIVVTKNMTASAIESVVNRVSSKKIVRGKALVTGSKADRKLLKAAWGDYGNVADMITNGGKYNDSAIANQQIEEGRQIFKTKPLEWARKKNSALLEVEDMWFAQPHYAYALAQYCKANNITAEQIQKGKAIAPARAYAIKEAQKATYRDVNAFSQMVSEWGRSGRDNKNPIKKAFNTVIEGILPFRRTPANILARGVEYSPIGLLKGLSYDLYKVSKGEITATEAIDNISAGLTGTGLLTLGVLLAAQELVRGHGEDDKEEKEFNELMGHQAYALELPNGQSFTLDWLAPEALPFFVGVNVWEATKGSDEDVNFSTILKAVSNISEPMLEMSCLQSLNDLFEGIGYATSNDTSGLVSILSSAATSYLTQGLPTLLGQAERTGEENRMTTYTEKDSFLTGDMQYTLGRASAKIPIWDYNQIPYIDAWGRKEASGTALKRGLNNFLNPSYTSTIDTSKMEKELLRLYEKTGEGGVFPSRADKYFTVDKKRKDLTAEEYVRYATLKGQKSYKVISDLVKSKAYKSLDDEGKIKAIKDAYAYADQKAKQAVSNYKPETWVKNADAFGSDAENYLSFRASVSDTKADNGGKISKQEVVDIILDMAQNDSEMWKMYLTQYDSTGDKYAYEKGVSGDAYMNFLDSLNDVDQPTKSGKYGTYTQAEVKKAISRTKGLSQKEKRVLYQSVNTKWKNNPY